MFFAVCIALFQLRYNKLIVEEMSHPFVSDDIEDDSVMMDLAAPSRLSAQLTHGAKTASKPAEKKSSRSQGAVRASPRTTVRTQDQPKKSSLKRPRDDDQPPTPKRGETRASKSKSVKGHTPPPSPDPRLPMTSVKHTPAVAIAGKGRAADLAVALGEARPHQTATRQLFPVERTAQRTTARPTLRPAPTPGATTTARRQLHIPPESQLTTMDNTQVTQDTPAVTQWSEYADEPVTATQELPADVTYPMPSPPPLFSLGSVSQPNAEGDDGEHRGAANAHAPVDKKVWESSMNDFFKFIDSRPLVVEEHSST